LVYDPGGIGPLAAKLMFKPRWAKKAVDELARLWIKNHSFRNVITEAANQIDRHLAADPYAVSESRPHGRRILFRSPLGVLFRVESDERTVSVLHVWLFKQRKN
jgi:hypothetical protein